MYLRNIAIGVVGVAAIMGMSALPALALCQAGGCSSDVPTSAVVYTPLQLQKFLRKPVASSASFVVKKPAGAPVHVTSVRHTKKRPLAVVAKPSDVAPDAAQAYASEPATSNAEAQVKVVTPDEVNDIDRTAGPAPTIVTAFADTSSAVDVVQAEEFNAIDRAADAARNLSFGAPPAQSASTSGLNEPQPEKRSKNATWLQRFVFVLGSAFAAAATAVRMIFT